MIEKNGTEVFGEGYVAGYNQARVDEGLMTQDEADKILGIGVYRNEQLSFTLTWEEVQRIVDTFDGDEDSEIATKLSKQLLKFANNSPEETKNEN